MQINFQDLVKEQAVYVALPIVLLAVLLGGIAYTGSLSITNISNFSSNNNTVQELRQKKADLENQLAQQKIEEQSPDIKKIYSLEGMKFGVDASFAPLFENMLSVAKDSGIRIRSAAYNYAPAEDPIFAAKIDGYNVCELETTVVGKYSELQVFLKTLLAEKYLVNISEMEIVSWQRDKSVLIANLKLRFYTKTK